MLLLNSIADIKMTCCHCSLWTCLSIVVFKRRSEHNCEESHLYVKNPFAESFQSNYLEFLRKIFYFALR